MTAYHHDSAEAVANSSILLSGAHVQYETEEQGMFSNLTNVTVSPGQLTIGASSMYTCKMYDFLIEALLMGILCVFGFCGNSLSMLCLLKDKSKTATPFLLVSLEVADTLFLVTVLILRVLSSLHMFTDWFPALEGAFPYLGKYIYPCALMAGTGTVYLTILVTVNRYISVCRPYEASDLCSIAYARKHVILVVICSILYNVPRFFEYEITEIFDVNSNQTVLILKPSAFDEYKVYQIVYKNILYFLVMFFIPLITLIILNYKLIKALRKTKKKRAQLLHSSDSSGRSEDDITLVLIVVVLVFVVCQTPALVTQVLLSLLDMSKRKCPNPYFFYERFSDLMVVANSSLNFLIYCFCSKKFRQILVMLVCKHKLESPEPSQIGHPRSGKNASPRPGTGQTHLVVPSDKRETSSAV